MTAAKKGIKKSRQLKASEQRLSQRFHRENIRRGCHMQQAGGQSEGERREKFKRYYETLQANYQAINYQLQTNDALSPEITAQLREKRKEIKANLQLLLAKLAASGGGGGGGSSDRQQAEPPSLLLGAAPQPQQAARPQAAAAAALDDSPQLLGSKTLQQVASEVNPQMHLREEAKTASLAGRLFNF